MTSKTYFHHLFAA